MFCLRFVICFFFPFFVLSVHLMQTKRSSFYILFDFFISILGKTEEKKTKTFRFSFIALEGVYRIIIRMRINIYLVKETTNKIQNMFYSKYESNQIHWNFNGFLLPVALHTASMAAFRFFFCFIQIVRE